jgi:glycerol kinase
VAEAIRVADFHRRLRFSLTPEHVLGSMVTPSRISRQPWRYEYTVSMSDVVVSLDSGTTSTRAMVFDRRGRPLGTAQVAHEQIFPQPGWVEHDALELWHNARQVLDQVVDACGLHATDVAALGITNQRETVVVWNRHTGKPIANAIVWQDTRTQSIVDELIAALPDGWVRTLTGLPLATYFSATKIRWLLDTVTGARDLANAGELLAGTVDSWLLWNLTGGVDGGVHETDVTNASRTQLMNLDTVDWDDALCDAFAVPRTMLPAIRPSAHVFGEVRIASSVSGVPIAGILGDQQAATFGQQAMRPGEVKNTYGTGNFLILSTGFDRVASTSGLLTTALFQRDGEPMRYALEGSIAVTGSLIQWLRDNLGIIGTSAESEALARSVPDSGDVVIVPAFSGLFAPYWRPDARGIIAGLTRFTNRAHIARAALESVALQTVDVIEAAAKDSGSALTELRVDGGMTANATLMQLQADLAGIPVLRPAVTETTALGAAFAAGLTVGFWVDEAELGSLWSLDRRFDPSMSDEERTRLRRNWAKGVERSLGWV